MTSVRTRILLFFTLFATASILAVYVSSRSTRIMGAAANNMVGQHLPMVTSLEEMEVALQRQDNAMYRYIVSGDKVWLDESEKERANYNQRYTDAVRLANQQIEQDKLTEIDEMYVQYDNQSRQVMLTSRADRARALRMLPASDQFLVKIQTLINEVEAMRQGMAIVRQEEIRTTLRRHSIVAYGFLVTIALCFATLWLYLFRFLVKPLSLLLDGIRNFTRGNTEIQIPKIGKDELGELQEAFNEMSRELTTERKKLKNESQSDPLTGLFNMRYFRSQLTEEFSRSQRYGRPLTLLMMDVDHFKTYNDRNGHPAGDIVLKEISRIFIRNVRGTDIVARYGGEEFVVLLPETPIDAGESVAEKIRRAVEEHHFPFAGSQGGQRVTVSIGVAAYPDVHVTSDQDLLEASDRALYSAKKAGRNRVQTSVHVDGNVSQEQKLFVASKKA